MMGVGIMSCAFFFIGCMLVYGSFDFGSGQFIDIGGLIIGIIMAFLGFIVLAIDVMQYY